VSPEAAPPAAERRAAGSHPAPQLVAAPIPGRSSAGDSGLRLLEPDSVGGLLRGWLIHCHKSRDRHNEAARRATRRQWRINLASIVLTAIVGSSVLAAIPTDVTRAPADLLSWLGLVVGALGIAAAILSSLLQTWNLPARAERHWSAATQYKGFIRELERLLTVDRDALARALSLKGDDNERLTELQRRLDDLEKSSPIVEQDVFDAIERRYRGARFVDEMIDQCDGDPGPASASALT
jgi:hypothetical protein